MLIKVLVAALLPLGALAATPDITDRPRIITIQGVGEVKVVPDELTFTVGIHTEGAQDPRRAHDDVSGIMRKTISVLKSHGIAEKNIQTSHVSVFPRYENINGHEKLMGYHANISVTAKLLQLGKYDEIATAVMEAGANEILGAEFSSTKMKEAETEARKRAMADARAKAEQLAEQAGAKVGRIISIRESDYKPAPRIEQKRFWGFNPMPGEVRAQGSGESSVSGGEIVIWSAIQTEWVLE